MSKHIYIKIETQDKHMHISIVNALNTIIKIWYTNHRWRCASRKAQEDKRDIRKNMFQSVLCTNHTAK